MPPIEYHDEKLAALARTAMNNGTRVVAIEPGDRIKSGKTGEMEEMILTCIGPESGLRTEPGNETSLVQDLTFGEFDMLLTGEWKGAGRESDPFQSAERL